MSLLETRYDLAEIIRTGRPGVQFSSPDGGAIMREYLPSDREAWFRVIDMDREHVVPYWGSQENVPTSSEDFFDTVLSLQSVNRASFGIWDREEQLIGNIDLTRQLIRPDTGLISYYLGKEFQGNGTAQKAVDATVGHAFRNLGYNLLQGRTFRDNIGSAKVLHHAGFQFEAETKSGVLFTLQK